MPFGYWGTCCVLISLIKINSESVPHEALKEWLGGTGLGVKYVFDKVTPSVNWDSQKIELFGFRSTRCYCC